MAYEKRRGLSRYVTAIHQRMLVASFDIDFEHLLRSIDQAHDSANKLLQKVEDLIFQDVPLEERCSMESKDLEEDSDD